MTSWRHVIKVYVNYPLISRDIYAEYPISHLVKTLLNPISEHLHDKRILSSFASAVQWAKIIQPEQARISKEQIETKPTAKRLVNYRVLL